MKIEKILKQLTPERIEKEIKAIQGVKLPPKLQKWVKEYEKVGDRDEFIWKWLYRMFQTVFLPTVSKKYKKSLLEIKVLITMFVVQLDDVSDKRKDKILLNGLLKIPFGQKDIKTIGLNENEKQYFKLTVDLWCYIEKAIKRYPRYKEFEEIFYYDINQVLNSINYSRLVNKNLYLINKTEYSLYCPHNMVVMIYSGIDLMCSPGFNIYKLGTIREILWYVQKMARIGNWISTWERELKENDFTSGVFAYAIDSKTVSFSNLKQKNKTDIVKKIKNADIRRKLLIEWEKYYYDVEIMSRNVEEINFKKFLFGLENLLILHLISQGYK